MRVALYQCHPLPLDVAGNLQRLKTIASQTKDVDLLVLPEMFLSGYNIGAQAVAELAQAHDGEAAQQIAELAKTTSMAIAYGYPERDANGHIYNSVQIIDSHGKSLCNYRKTHLFGELDRGMFSAGPDAFPVFELNGWKLGVLICYDLEFPENTRRLALAGAELIVVPTANMAPYDFIADVTVRCRAFENQCYVAYANYCGHEGSIQYCGQSSIAAPNGLQVALAKQTETLITATLERQQLLDAKTANVYLADRRPELYNALSKR
ncbi:carbon-nitrogen hydrolase family protein [Pseudomonas sp. CCC3.1]|uniref:carbon-nitrogen hydrolase family protein n=1 Tax=Pseudomonas sp. CCC3.1 TaxID=3048607 RepID=UPI002AC90245|nr:carbon-nitrogen hydrolase family protein [Pseudomonas sp. CCC3.1]MEB0207781.1 carbon-nitrogen hydrolase family protein [Pseudomonas sp. CCC3.1]WPX36584.1 carbon-nitrogen hydrolase family protein [Pseudomonas sp. CCC3.1]